MFDFGLRLQELRMSRNLSQQALGKKINRSKSVIYAYENNLRIFKIILLLMLDLMCLKIYQIQKHQTTLSK